MVRSRSLQVKLFSLAALLVVLAILHSIWMAWMGVFLVKADDPFPADLVVVLAGDYYGHRILKGGELVKRGFAPKALVSGPPGFYDLQETDLAIPFAVKHGYPAEWFIPFRHSAHSTDEEAQAILPELRKRRARRLILVTSDYHTRRAGRIFRSQGRDFEMRVVAVPDEFFRPREWWLTREGRKIFFLEWTKTIAGLIGL